MRKLAWDSLEKKSTHANTLTRTMGKLFVTVFAFAPAQKETV